MYYFLLSLLVSSVLMRQNLRETGNNPAIIPYRSKNHTPLWEACPVLNLHDSEYRGLFSITMGEWYAKTDLVLSIRIIMEIGHRTKS